MSKQVSFNFMFYICHNDNSKTQWNAKSIRYTVVDKVFHLIGSAKKCAKLDFVKVLALTLWVRRSSDPGSSQDLAKYLFNTLQDAFFPSDYSEKSPSIMQNEDR